MNETAVLPHIGDSVLLWGERGTIVDLLLGQVTVNCESDMQVVAPTDRLRWVFDRSAWVLVTEETA